MSAFRISGFSGLVPRLAKHLLNPNQAQTATNCDLAAGDLRPRNAPLPVSSPQLDGEIRSMFRIEKDGSEKWLVWSRDVDVARSPVAGDTRQRFYYTGDGEPRTSDFEMATAGAGTYPLDRYVLGVTPPVSEPLVMASGGRGAVTSRTYVYTFVTQWGEESKPSPASIVISGKIDATWMISNMDAAPPNSGAVIAILKNSPAVGQVEITLDRKCQNFCV